MYKFTITVLQILGLTLFTVASPFQNKECSNLPPKQRFNPLPYFNGEWYTTHIHIDGEPIEPDQMPCITSKSEILVERFAREVSSQYNPKSNEFNHFEAIINMAEFSVGRGKYTEIARFINADGKPLTPYVGVPVTILETDYTSYSLVYTCVTIENQNLSVYTILSRNQDATITSPQVEEMLVRLGLKLDDFVSIEDVNCKKDPALEIL